MRIASASASSTVISVIDCHSLLPPGDSSRYIRRRGLPQSLLTSLNDVPVCVAFAERITPFPNPQGPGWFAKLPAVILSLS